MPAVPIGGRISVLPSPLKSAVTTERHPVVSENQISLRRLGLCSGPQRGVTERYVAKIASYVGVNAPLHRGP
jgi:hypothetical protein